MKKKTKTKTKPRYQAEPSGKPTLVAVLLDQSGSMADPPSKRTETITAFNEYLDGLRSKPVPGMRLSFTLFNAQQVEQRLVAMKLEKVPRLTAGNYKPVGYTPLYDAVGDTIQTTEKFAKENGYTVLFVILTDGLENSSREWTKAAITAEMKRVEKSGWTFAFIGVGVEGWSGAQNLAAGTQSFANVVHSDPDKVRATMRRAGGQSVSYAAMRMKHDDMAVAADFWENKPKKS